MLFDACAPWNSSSSTETHFRVDNVDRREARVAPHASSSITRSSWSMPSQRRSVVEVHLQNAHRSVPGRVAIFLAREQVVAVLSAMSFQRGRKQIVDLCIGQIKVPSLIRVEFDRNRLVTAMEEHVPSVRMSLHTLVMGDVQHGRTVALAPRRARFRRNRATRVSRRCDDARVGAERRQSLRCQQAPATRSSSSSSAATCIRTGPLTRRR